MRRLAAALALAVTLATPARAEQTLSFPSFDAGVTLTSHWFPVGSATAGAVVLLHGCNGISGPRGGVSQRLREYAALVNRAGLHALVVDSFGPRGETEICTQRFGSRRVTQRNRRADALAALDFLAARSDVDPARLGLLGWSNGGSTVLAATNLREADVAASSAKPAFAIAFYPGCEADLRRGYVASTRLLMLVGAADDWTAAAPCEELARRAEGIAPQIETYAGAYHGFDTDVPLRLLRNVPGGVHPGQGVHLGGDADALRRSRERMLDFIAAALTHPAGRSP